MEMGLANSENLIVISGISGRFSGASDIVELWDRLCNGEKLYGKEDTLYPKVFQNIPKARGSIKESRKFDNNFFGLTVEEANLIDGQVRLLYEVTYEAFCDAGILPNEWSQTKTGVFIGSFVDDTDLTARSTPIIQSLPTRLSYHFNLRGPSIRVDTACASSLTALQLAKLSLDSGDCDQAIVAGLCLHQRTFLNPHFCDFGILSKRGLSSPLDCDADGYVRSEAIISMIMQRKPSAKRIYAQIIGMKSNTDGYTKEGLTFPSRSAQKSAMVGALEAGKVKPADINYIEAHLTGTQAGDRTECLSILDAYRSERPEPIYVGALKSNLGHTEAAAGLASLTKAVLILQNELIPPMIPPNEYNPAIEPLVQGKVIPVTSKKRFHDNLIAVNAFGFGGANVHVILRGNEKIEATWTKAKERLILLANRTETGIEKTFDLLEKDKESRSNEFLSLLDHLSCSTPESGMMYRAYGIISENESVRTKVVRRISETKRLGLVVLSPLLMLPPDLSSIPEFNEYLNCAKPSNELASTISIIEFFLFLGLNIDLAIAFDPAITALSAYIKSFKQTVADWSPTRQTKKNLCDSLDANKLHKYIKALSNPSQDTLTDGDVTVWCSKKYKNAMNHYIEDTFFLIIDGHVRLSNGLDFRQNCSSSLQSIWQIIGELYLLGQNINLEKIHPRIEYPVHKKCPSISQLIQWDHSNEFNGDLYPDYYLSANQTIQHIDLFDPEYANTSDHIIDGRVIMPASGFIYLIGKHLGLMYFDRPLSVGQFNFRVWDVKFIEACSMNEEVDITITHDPVTFKFVIKSSECVFVTGSASIASTSPPDTSMESHLRSDSVQDDDELKQSDIYQNGRLRGYHFERKYKNVSQLKASRSTGYVKYSGDWIAFLDALIQMDQFWEKSRLLKVPTSLKNFSFDCDHFNKALNELKDPGGSPSLMVSSPAYGYVKTFGFHLDGLGWTAIKRRDFDQPRLAISEFRSYLNNFISLSAQESKERQEYHESCLTLLHERDYNVAVGEEANKSLVRILTKMRNSQQPLSDLIEQESQHLWNDILTTWPNEALNSVLDVVIGNTIKSEVIRIGYQKHLSTFLRNKMATQSQKHRKFSEFFDLNREPVKDLDLIVWLDQSSRLLPQDNNDSIESFLNKYKSLSQHFVLIQSRNELSQVEQEILIRLNCNNSGKQTLKKLDIEHFGYIKVAESLVEQSFMKFDLYRKKLETNGLSLRQIMIVGNDYGWVDEIRQSLDDNVDRIWLLSTETNSGIFGLFNCLYLEPKGKRLRCLYRADGKDFQDSSDEMHEIIEKDLTINIHKNGSWGYMTLRDIEMEKENRIISDHYYCTFERAGMLETLNWTENHSKTVCSKEKLIKVAYAAINFRDTLIASGVVPVEAYPKENCFDLGLEFAGVTPEGKRVMGVVLSKGFASYIPIDSVGFMFMVPDNWSLREAATVPVCYISAYYSLIVRGGLKPGETVLIHSGSGGVGLAAISIALNLGCKVFTTVSSREKRFAVISMFPQLNESSSFADSRSTSFEDHILIHTNGRGVDIVLNSLTDDKLAAGIRCLAQGGRFIDLSKRDFIQDSPLETFQLEDNKTFETVCLVYLLTSIESNTRSKGALKMIEKLLEAGFETGQIVPLPNQVYDKQSIEQAFRVMRKGQHIGKLLIKMNEIDEKLNFQIEPLLVKRRTYFYPNKSYLVVGGLGGMGVELIRWMVIRGARKIVISSRSGLKTGFQRSCLKNARELTNNQATIVIVRFDLSSFRGSARAIRETTRLGPIGGIFNLAAVLKDNLFENQSKDSFEVVCDPKVEITKNLDRISRNECNDLDYFVCFSSIAVQGNLGQSNYAYANSFIESICETRKRDGLPALAIEWGPIADVGLAARTFGDKQALSNYRNQSVDSFLITLDVLLGLDHPVCYSAIQSVENTTRSSDAFTKVARIMGLKDIESVDHNKTLRELGIDSVQAIEIQIYLSQEFKQSVKQFTIAELTLNDLKTMGQSSSVYGEFGGNTVIKEQLLVPLNGAVENTIFFFPPAVADFLSMMPLAEVLECQVIGVNYTDEALAIEQFDRLTELYYQEIMKNHSHLSEYFFVAYSFGVPIAFDLARKIQTRLGEDRIRKMIFIDTSPVGQQQSYKFFRRLRESGSFNWETMKDPRLSMDRKRKAQNDRLKIVNVLERITGDSGEKNAEIFFGFWDKMASIIDLTFERKFNGKVLHYQANEQPSALLDNLNHDLGKAVNGLVETRFIKSNHFEIISDGKDEILAGIREYLPQKFE